LFCQGVNCRDIRALLQGYRAFLHCLRAVTRSLWNRSICRNYLPTTKTLGDLLRLLLPLLPLLKYCAVQKLAESMIGLLKLKQFVLSRCQLQGCKGITLGCAPPRFIVWVLYIRGLRLNSEPYLLMSIYLTAGHYTVISALTNVAVSVLTALCFPLSKLCR
jgi:hypothetical protein